MEKLIQASLNILLTTMGKCDNEYFSNIYRYNVELGNIVRVLWDFNFFLACVFSKSNAIRMDVCVCKVRYQWRIQKIHLGGPQ